MSDLVKKESNLPGSAEEMAIAWGEKPTLTSQDIVIPRILLMQAMSEMVGEGEANIGDFVDSLTKDKLGNSKTPLKFVPFYLKKLWVEYQVLADGKKKFLKLFPITNANEDFTYEDTIQHEGAKIKVSRDRLMDFYVLLPEQEKTGGLPYIISFRRSSLKAGKKLATQMYVKNPASGKYPPSVVCELSNSNFKGDKGNYNILDVRPLNETSEAMMQKALYWVKMITSGQVKEDNTGLDEMTDVAGGSDDMKDSAF